MLYDLTSVWLEGRRCPLAKRGYSRDGKRGKLQIEFGLLCDAEGRPVAVEVFDGNTADPGPWGRRSTSCGIGSGSPGWCWWATAGC